MKLITRIAYCLFFILVIIACSDSEEEHKECFFCEITSSEYCITEGDDFYTITTSTSAEVVLLENNFWSDILSQLQNECDIEPQLNCYTCESENTEYCYLEGDTFYTTTIDGTETQTDLNNQTWEEIREELEMNCPIEEQDCYTCVSDATEYCYNNDDDFYTATNNGNEIEILLDDQAWDEIRTQLESDCDDDSGNVASNRALMTAVIDGADFPVLQPTFYPAISDATIIMNFFGQEDNYLQIQGNDNPNDFAAVTRQITLLINERDWQVGTFDIEADETNQKSHFNMLYAGPESLNAIDIDGTITITNFDLDTRLIEGTFILNYNLTDSSGPYLATGTFDYSLDAEFFD